MERVDVRVRFDGQPAEVKFEWKPLNLSVHPSNILFPSKDRVTFLCQMGCNSKAPMVSVEYSFPIRRVKLITQRQKN
jgi:hypothetical protein